MKKYLPALLFLFTVFLFASCNEKNYRCDNPAYVPQAGLMETYFGNYKPGAYWIYLNRDSTKRDSVWVGNFITGKSVSKYDCEYGEERSFSFNSAYFYFYAKAEQLSINFNTGDLHTNTLIMNESYWLCNARNGKDNFYLAGAIDIPSGNPVEYPIVTNYKLWQDQPDNTLDTVSVIRNFVAAPQMGIVQFFPTNSDDTFSLIKYYIP